MLILILILIALIGFTLFLKWVKNTNRNFDDYFTEEIDIERANKSSDY